MYFYSIQIDRITAEQIMLARKIIPSLELTPINSLEEAFRVAVEKASPKLDRLEFISDKRNLVTLPAGTPRTGADAHFVEVTEDGWFFQLAVLGD